MEKLEREGIRKAFTKTLERRPLGTPLATTTVLRKKWRNKIT